MKKIGITGQNGFVGDYLYNTLGLYPEKYQRIAFEKSVFDDKLALDAFVSSCDVIVHLAGMNRHNAPHIIYETNVLLAQKLVDALLRTGSKPHVIFSSSTQEDRDNLYGKSKRDARIILSQWANDSNAVFTGMLIPNVFGPFGKPFYNSVIATFCHQLSRNETPVIEVDSELKLIYVGELVQEILEVISNNINATELQIAHTSLIKVTDILKLLISFKEQYLYAGVIPAINSGFEINLFNSFRSYDDIKLKFPIKYQKKIDQRGSFTEIVRLEIGGQVSFSITHSGVTRGNHFHTRKIERFAVIRGKALIQLRRIGTDEVLNFYLSGDEPAFVDMPIWFTHNIKNIGDTELYTIFWINECYDPEDSDTFFEKV